MNTANNINRTWLMVSLLFTIYYLLITPLAFGAFEDTGTGARASALGGAYVALGDDTLSLFYNPASLARLRQIEIATEYSRLFAGLSDGSELGQYAFVAGVPLHSAGTLTFGWKQFGVNGLYTERTLALGYGQWLTTRWAAGFSLKQLHHTFAVPNTVVDDNGFVQGNAPSLFRENGDSTNAFSVDTGLLYRLTDRQYLGFSIHDVNQPNVALDPNDSDLVARSWHIGWSFQKASRLSFTAEVTTRQCACDSRDYVGAGGLEKWWATPSSGDFAARGAMALGSREFRQFSTGFGYRWQALELNYAFVFDLSGLSLGPTAGTHRFSLAYRFGSGPTPATTPVGTPIEDLPVNILRAPGGATDDDASYSLEPEVPEIPKKEP